MCFEGEQILWLEDRETTMAALAIRNDVGPDDLDTSKNRVSGTG
jgi:hypothetical protein